jgi:hypothetical protein
MIGPLLRSVIPKVRERLPGPGLAVVAVVGLWLGGLLVGYAPVGGDPDGMYRPIKSELARALGQGTLPYWSDRFGLGAPLVAESHVAAFYPANLLLYRLLSVPAAYRLAMWLHYVALAVATYAYARTLAITPWGSALAALSFTLGGFLASHSCHEPFYHLMPYLPLCLLMAERFLAGGSIGWAAGLALALGTQITLGHFQFQMWTAALVVLTAFWRAAIDGRPWWRAFALLGAVAGGFAVASVQLMLTWELTRIASFSRDSRYLITYAFPTAHWAQLASPGLFLGLKAGFRDPYWSQQATSPEEATLYIGTVPLVLAFVGLLARRDRALAPWRLIAPLGFLVATMPRWWPDAYLWTLQQLPGVAQFRAPGRYTLLTCLGLSLLAGRGFDRLIPARRFAIGLALAVAFGAAAGAWGLAWSLRPEVAPGLGNPGRAFHLACAALAWGTALAALIAWRRGRLGSWGPFALAAVELGSLFYQAPTTWGWPVPLPEASPVLRRLLQEPEVGLVAGRLQNIPVRAGLTAAYPNFGITPPPPNYLLLEPTTVPSPSDPQRLPWLSRFGVTHGVWAGATPFRSDAQVLFTGPDPALDAARNADPMAPVPHLWRVERYPPAAPPARVALVVREAKDWYELFPTLSNSYHPEEVWFEQADLPPEAPGPRARTARLLHWDDRSGLVEHDGTCDLVLRRTYYPGWTAQLDDGPEVPVLRADGGLQAVRIPGTGQTRVRVRYRPRALVAGATLSTVAISLALAVLALEARRAFRRR